MTSVKSVLKNVPYPFRRHLG